MTNKFTQDNEFPLPLNNSTASVVADWLYSHIFEPVVKLIDKATTKKVSDEQ